MNTIALIVPYYGKFPGYFQLFLNTCRQNPTIDWLLFTDIMDPYDYPDNVHLVQQSFEELRVYFQNKFAFPIVLEKPYKLCDYKPAYGYLFEEYLDGYDYWGYCDIDLLFGDLRAFLPDAELEKYDKIGHLGHLSLYRNRPDINRLFLSEFNGRARYKEVYTTNHSCVFDEWDDLSINKMFLLSGKRVWIWNEFFDAYPNHDNLVKVTTDFDINTRKKSTEIARCASFITWENGRIFSKQWHLTGWTTTELAYAHFQKRSMAVDCSRNEANILCLPTNFVPLRKGIPFQYLLSGAFHQVFNWKLFKHAYLTVRYFLIVITAPIRHKFRNR